MSPSTTLVCTIAISCAAVALGGCNRAVSAPVFPLQSPPSRSSAAGPARASRNSERPLVYVSDFLGAFVDVFRRDGTLVGRIRNGLDHPAGLFVDERQNLWVANGGDGNVLRFRRGSTKASVYTGVPNAYAVTTCSDGTLYVANYSGTIAVFAPRHHSPTGSLTEGYGLATSVACDKLGNIFVASTLLSPPGYVVEFPARSTQAKLLPINLFNPVDAKPDPAGNLLVLDSAGGDYNTVNEYTESGYPTGKSMPTGANWAEMAVSPNGKQIFGADLNDLDGTVRRFSSGARLRTYADSMFKQPGGIAFDPGARP